MIDGYELWNHLMLFSCL